jgi:predicted enzyme related to lactoylglutathione lyase
MAADPRNDRFDYLEFVTGSPNELQRTQDFLAEVFGWSYRAWCDGCADTEDSGLVSGISVEAGAASIPLPVVYSTDLEHLHGRIEAAGGEVTREILSFPGGRRFHFREPSGTELAAWTQAEE